MGIITLILGFITGPIGRYVAGAVGIIAIVGSVYLKGRYDQRVSDKAALQAEIAQSIAKGEQGKADALKKFDEGHMPANYFRD